MTRGGDHSVVASVAGVPIDPSRLNAVGDFVLTEVEELRALADPVHRWLAAVASGFMLAGIVAGCGGGGSSSTELRVHLFQAYAGVADYTVQCDPNGGTVKDPDGVCVALRQTPGLLRFHAATWDHPCPGGALQSA